uniref:Uncharacterized protein n=1 Tax=Romanomermis culicivorax TaxID=13658 RepID=A0A915I2M4_ROMCU
MRWKKPVMESAAVKRLAATAGFEAAYTWPRAGFIKETKALAELQPKL